MNCLSGNQVQNQKRGYGMTRQGGESKDNVQEECSGCQIAYMKKQS